MAGLEAYSIPVSGLNDGMHRFDYQIDNNFFKHFPDSLITDGAFKVQLNFDKRPDMIELLFDFDGSINTICDRCLEAMSLPFDGQERLIMKFSEEAKEELEIVYIPFNIQELNVAKYIYEFICLTIPLIKTHDLANDSSCDPTMISYLNQEGEAPKENPIWDKLKNIKFN